MPKSPAIVSTDIVNLMHRQNLNCTTIPWYKFYEVCERERLQDSFLKSLERELKKKSFLMIKGQVVICIAKDFNFSELELN